MIENFLKELRDSADIQFEIFTKGSCFRLYKIIKTILPKAEAYWSDIDGHCITKVEGKFYDIGGEVNKEYIVDKSYYKVDKKLLKGFSLFKWLDKDRNIGVGVAVQKYK